MLVPQTFSVPLFSGVPLFYAIWFGVSTLQIYTKNNTEFLFTLNL